MRKVDHAIDLAADAAPIAKPPYRHSLAQSVELENQLNDLLNNGYIRPSKSPWRAPVLFTRKKDGSLRKDYLAKNLLLGRIRNFHSQLAHFYGLHRAG